MDDYLPLLVILGLGGLVIYVIMRQQQPAQQPVVDRTTGAQCGASYLGVGASVPCQYLAAGIKQLSSEAQSVLKPVTTNLKTAASGIKPWEYVVTPVAITHATVNEAKAVLNYINPF